MRNKILFICPYPAGEAPSQRFRFEQYFHVLRKNNFEFNQYSFWSKKNWAILYSNGNYLRKTIGLLAGYSKRLFQLLWYVPTADYVFIHREATPLGPPWFEWMSAKVFNKKIIYDFDDAIWLANTSEENKLSAWLKWHSKVKWICKWSYKVSCGNQYLCDFAKEYNQNVVLNPTTIDTENLHNPFIVKRDIIEDLITIGWTGTHSTLKYLEGIKPVLEILHNQFSGKIKFLIISDKKPSTEISSLQFIEWSKSTEIDDLVKFDIGIMPLTDDTWSNGKCGFKALQYMSLGIATVASPVGVNKIIIEDGVNGYLCASYEEWLTKLSLLINNEELRSQLGKMGRTKVVESYSLLSNASNFLCLFS